MKAATLLLGLGLVLSASSVHAASLSGEKIKV